MSTAIRILSAFTALPRRILQLTFPVRAQKTSGLADAPAWEFSQQVSTETAESKSFAYSPDGAYFAQALNGRYVRLHVMHRLGL